MSLSGVPLRFLAGLFTPPSFVFCAAARFEGLLDRLLLESFRGTEVVLVILLPGLPSRGSASTVTLMRHGLTSPAPPGVSRMTDLDGVALRRFILRGDGLRLVRGFRSECATSGDEGRVMGSGEVSLPEDASPTRAMVSR